VSERWFPDAMPRPAVDADTAPFFEAAARHQLVVQRCTACGAHRHPPRPLCPHCHAFDVAWEQVSGRGTLFSWSVVHQPFLPQLADKVPFVVAVVELEGTGGTRMTSNLVDADLAALAAGLAVEVVFEDMAGGLTLPRFTPA